MIASPRNIPLHIYMQSRLASVPPANRTPMFRAIVTREWKAARPQGHYRGSKTWKRTGSSGKGIMHLAKMMATKLKLPWQSVMRLLTAPAPGRQARRRQAR